MSKHDPDLNAMFAALSDPTRRAVLSRLMQGPAPVTELARPFDMALPTFMSHLARLEAAHLISTRKQGRTRTCFAVENGLTPATDWIAEQREIWNARLDRLEEYLESLTEQKDPAP